MKRQIFIFIGLSGSGKGTQVTLLEEYMKKQDPNRTAFVYQSGDQFRTFMGGNTHSQRLSRAIMERGEMQPSFLAIWMWTNAFVANIRGDEHILLDGAPRTQGQAQVLDSARQFYSWEKPYAIVITISKTEAIKRLLARGRADDTKEAIKSRLDFYDADVLPTIAYYREHPHYQLIEVDGEQGAGEVHEDIIRKLSLETTVHDKYSKDA